MATEVQTQTGQCMTHGTIQATREIPKMGFPFIVHLQMLGNWALGRGFDLPDLDVHRPTLEEVYLSLTSPVSAKDQR